MKKRAAFKWKDTISGFPVSPGSAEALVRCGGKIKYVLIAYFLGNICAKNCRNRTVYVKIIASCKGETFLRHSVHENQDMWLSLRIQKHILYIKLKLTYILNRIGWPNI